MILGFKTTFPWGEPTSFVNKIVGCWERLSSCSKPVQVRKQTKFHTIRAGNRIGAGDKLHMATGVRTKDYNQFNKGVPGLGLCRSTQGIVIYREEKEVLIAKFGGTIKGEKHYEYFLQTDKQVEVLAENDGMTVEQFWAWFDKDFTGQIIHWTDLRY